MGCRSHQPSPSETLTPRFLMPQQLAARAFSNPPVLFIGQQQRRDLLQRPGQPVHPGGLPPDRRPGLRRALLGRRAQRHPRGDLLQGEHGPRAAEESLQRHPQALQGHVLFLCHLGLHRHLGGGHFLRREQHDAGRSTRPCASMGSVRWLCIHLCTNIHRGVRLGRALCSPVAGHQGPVLLSTSPARCSQSSRDSIGWQAACQDMALTPLRIIQPQSSCGCADASLPPCLEHSGNAEIFLWTGTSD